MSDGEEVSDVKAVLAANTLVGNKNLFSSEGKRG
jgi:hypothetical protein